MSLQAHDWGLTAQAVPGRAIPYPRGRVTGGSSALARSRADSDPAGLSRRGLPRAGLRGGHRPQPPRIDRHQPDTGATGRRASGSPPQSATCCRPEPPAAVSPSGRATWSTGSCSRATQERLASSGGPRAPGSEGGLRQARSRSRQGRSPRPLSLLRYGIGPKANPGRAGHRGDGATCPGVGAEPRFDHPAQPGHVGVVAGQSTTPISPRRAGRPALYPAAGSDEFNDMQLHIINGQGFPRLRSSGDRAVARLRLAVRVHGSCPSLPRPRWRRAAWPWPVSIRACSPQIPLELHGRSGGYAAAG